MRLINCATASITPANRKVYLIVVLQDKDGDGKADHQHTSQ